MKKIVLTLFGLLLLFLFAYGVWVQVPGLKQPDKLAALLSTSQQRWDAMQAQAKDPAKNGYLSPTFLPYWGRKGMEGKEGSPGGVAVRAWNDYSSQASGKTIDHEALARDSAYLYALENFEKIVPELTQAMRRPVFVTPDTPKADFFVTIPNLISVRAAGQAVYGLAEARMVQGRPVEAARLIGSMALFAKSLSHQGTLIQEMIATGVGMSAGDAYVALLDSSVKMPAEDWKGLAKDLIAAVPAQDQAAAAMENDLCWGVNTLEKVRSGAYPVADLEAGQVPSYLPGWLAREQRIYCNLMVDITAEMRQKQGTVVPDSVTHPSALDYFTGDIGMISEALIPNHTRCEGVIIRNQQRLTALALVSATRAFVAEKGRLPANVEEMKTAQIPTPDPSRLGPDGVSFGSDGKTVTIKAEYPTFAEQKAAETFPPTKPWADESKLGTLLYQVYAPD